MAESKRKIAILGAGPSGLVAAKECLENGLIPTVFEKESQLGGVWNPSTGYVWDTMHTNISKFTTTFGDTDWPEATEMFPSATSVFTYLNEYAKKWKVTECIKFNANIAKVTPFYSTDAEQPRKIGHEGWTVQWEDKNDLLSRSDRFHGLIVATGVFSEANIPEIPGLDTFPGKIIHSNKYKSGAGFEGMRVMTVGGSFSGAEIAADVANYADETIHSFREPFWILRRCLPDSQRSQANVPLDLLFYTRKFYSQKQEISAEETCRSKNKHMAVLCEKQQDFEKLRISSESFGSPINVVVSDQYLNQVEKGCLFPTKQIISEIKGSKCILDNGDVHDVQAIIFATGFRTALNYFDDDVLQSICYDKSDRLQPVVLCHESFHPNLENLFFVGMYKGPYFGVIEQQARLAARVLSDNVSLPPLNDIIDGLRNEMSIRNQRPRPQFPHPEYVYFADEIAKLGNSFPDLNKFKSDDYTLSDALGHPLKSNSLHLEQIKPQIYNRFMTESVTPSHYNLVSDSDKTIKQMDLVQLTIQTFM